MTKNEFYFSSADSATRIHVVEWLPEGEPKAVLQISHGAAQHVLGYEKLAEFFTNHGFVVVGSDYADHDIRHCGQEEMQTCLKITKGKYPDIPYLLLGMSQGALEVHSFILSHPAAVEGVVLADMEQKTQNMEKDIPVLQVSGVEENCQEIFRYIYSWTEERLDEMLYRAATKHKKDSTKDSTCSFAV